MELEHYLLMRRMTSARPHSTSARCRLAIAPNLPHEKPDRHDSQEARERAAQREAGQLNRDDRAEVCTDQEPGAKQQRVRNVHLTVAIVLIRAKQPDRWQ